MNRIIKSYNFWRKFLYYLRMGQTLRDAWDLSHRTFRD